MPSLVFGAFLFAQPLHTCSGLSLRSSFSLPGGGKDTPTGTWLVLGGAGAEGGVGRFRGCAIQPFIFPSEFCFCWLRIF